MWCYPNQNTNGILFIFNLRFFLKRKELVIKWLKCILKNRHGRSTRKNLKKKSNEAGLIKIYEILVKFYGVDIEICS